MNGIMKGLALDEVTRSIIMVAGVGGAGGNALNHMIDLGINDVTFMATNTITLAAQYEESDDVVMSYNTASLASDGTTVPVRTSMPMPPVR